MNVELTAREGITPRCAICHDDALEGPLLCPECRTIVHAECRVGLPCPTLGCPHGPRPHAREHTRFVVIRTSLAGAARDAARRALRTLRPPLELVVAFVVTVAMLGSLAALSQLE